MGSTTVQTVSSNVSNVWFYFSSESVRTIYYLPVALQLFWKVMIRVTWNPKIVPRISGKSAINITRLNYSFRFAALPTLLHQTSQVTSKQSSYILILSPYVFRIFPQFTASIISSPCFSFAQETFFHQLNQLINALKTRKPAIQMIVCSSEIPENIKNNGN